MSPWAVRIVTLPSLFRETASASTVVPGWARARSGGSGCCAWALLLAGAVRACAVWFGGVWFGGGWFGDAWFAWPWFGGGWPA